ncbi:hypothetical protein [Burkholderia metallica]|uniref:hypothetical protein n=1 Tax=Burkholderia metallica TaxID=488729 RepID=UPI001CF54ABC|nr:hypothetical protein [Burkholderia metallica]MCA8002400.1 hypothetical protein [Burkholderia metallica]
MQFLEELMLIGYQSARRRAAPHTFARLCAIARVDPGAMRGLDFRLTVPLTRI